MKKENGRRETGPGGPPREPDLPTHSEDGVDLTLIRWMLSLTPLERLRALEDTVRSLMELRTLAEKSRR
jgi:hypothetical protein